jgi:hypothetical protein
MNNPCVIQTTNLSHGWAKALIKATESPKGEIQLFTISVIGFNAGQPLEDSLIRRNLDECLRQEDQFSCQTVANTIFPISLWNPRKPRTALYERYLKILAKLRGCGHYNRYGIYFERLINYKRDDQVFNQVEHILQTYTSGNHRRSALQGIIFDPTSDHTNQRQRGFPCLHQVAFCPTPDGGLAITGFYAMQRLFDKAYGNYLGLCRLGNFVAHELGLRLNRMNCIANVATCGDPPRRFTEQIKLADLDAQILCG